jgi:MbtH protein
MSRNDGSRAETIYKVVVNHEEQYSIWPADRENAAGWTDAGPTGGKDECLAHVERLRSKAQPGFVRGRMNRAESDQ